MSDPAPHIPTVAAEIAGWLRIQADNLTGSIEMAEARGAETDGLKGHLAAMLQFERLHTARAKAVKPETLPLYEPRWPSRRDGDE